MVSENPRMPRRGEMGNGRESGCRTIKNAVKTMSIDADWN